MQYPSLFNVSYDHLWKCSRLILLVMLGKDPGGQVVSPLDFESHSPGLKFRLLVTVQHFIAQSVSLSSFHCLDMT